MSQRSRLVYSSGGDRCCAKCGWPTGSCRCASPVDQPIPEAIVARLAVERAGRKGKTVTVVYGLPRNRTFLQDLGAELRRALGTGGSVGEDRVEVQGEHSDAVRRLLEQRGFQVKG